MPAQLVAGLVTTSAVWP
ncbi:hypothetical protein WJX74_003081, partial [Apatococcus lobatus]